MILFWILQGAALVLCVMIIIDALRDRNEEKVRCGCGMRVFNHGSRKHRRRMTPAALDGETP